MSRKIRMGMMGGGSTSFIGIVHRIASYMGESYELVGGAFDVDYERAIAFAKELELDPSRAYDNIDTFIEKELALPESERIEVVVIVTPNNLHYSMAKKLIEADFHVICEKPVTITSQEAEDLAKSLEDHPVVFGLTHTYTGYPMIRQMKTMIAEGVIGRIQRVDFQYYQGWINPVIHDVEKRKTVWRLNPEMSGISCCIGDVGVHAFNMLEYTTGLQVEKVLSDIETLYDDNPMDIDGTVLLRMSNGSKGVIRASQIATAEENAFTVAVYGDKGGLKWAQEDPTRLTHLSEGEPARTLTPGNAYIGDFAMESTKMAPGHPEGIFDAMGNIYKGVAKAIRGEKYTEGAFPSINEGVRGMHFVEAVVQSSKDGNVWKTI